MSNFAKKTYLVLLIVFGIASVVYQILAPKKDRWKAAVVSSLFSAACAPMLYNK